MGVSGAWALRARQDYTGASKWGNGYDPIHGVRDSGRGRVIGTRENLLPLGEPSDVVAQGLTARDIDYVVEDYVVDHLPGEWYRYEGEHPNWSATTPQFRDAIDGNPVMGEWASWGVYNDDDPSDIWPRPGPTGGMSSALDISHGEDIEQQYAIAVPTQPVAGGWRNKARGAQAQPEAQEASTPGLVWTINTAAIQGPGLKESANDRALQRGTDTPRTAVTSRVAGMVEKAYAQSFRMGGGPGAPDMYPRQLTAGLKRPFWTRQAAVPPDADYQFNTMEGRAALQRTVPPDPYQGDFEVGTDQTALADWGY